MIARGIYRHNNGNGWVTRYFRISPKYQREDDITIVERDNYTLVQVVTGNIMATLKLFDKGEVCMKGKILSDKVLNEEELKEEMEWCIEQYERDLKEENNM